MLLVVMEPKASENVEEGSETIDDLLARVPQGSNLGPVLLLIFIDNTLTTEGEITHP